MVQNPASLHQWHFDGQQAISFLLGEEKLAMNGGGLT
jgi:hypothetical protein